jgi:preprotein translocase subunit SecD
MKKNLNLRVVITLAIIALCVYAFYPPKDKLQLGLDLQGGIHLVLQVITADAVKAEVDQTGERIIHDLREKGILTTFKRSEEMALELTAAQADKKPEVDTYLEGNYSAGWGIRSFTQDGKLQWLLALKPSYRTSLEEMTVRQALEIVRQRVDSLGVREPTLQLYGSSGTLVNDQIIVELPGIDDPGRVKDIIQNTAQLALKLIAPEKGGPYPTREGAQQAWNNSIPSDLEVLPYAGRNEQSAEKGTAIEYMVVRKSAVITGKHLKNARRSMDRFNKPEVSFYMNPEGAQLFGNATAANIGKPLAIVLDNKVMSYAIINARITDAGVIESPYFTIQSAEDLALVLRSGALPASIQILEENTVGPSLGLDSIRQGVISSIVGLALVVVGMLIYYKFSGLNAVFALLINLIILLGAMGYFGAVLTLPGIAGVILSTGMAVDSNILIFERIKEELRAGKTIRSAVETGFGKVFWTIFDTHLTTLISSAFLFQFGTGPIRGFAVTLAVGLIANMFTAIYVSRTVFELILTKRQVQQLSI